jgi:hypothetical protein
MSELTDKIAELKAQFPTLSQGINDQVIELSKAEYEATIEAWAAELIANPPKPQHFTPQGGN